MEIILQYNIVYLSIISSVMIVCLVAVRLLFGSRVYRIFFPAAWTGVLLRFLVPLCIGVPSGGGFGLTELCRKIQDIPFYRFAWIWGIGACLVACAFLARYIFSGRMLREALPIQKVPDIDEEMFTFMGIRVYVSDRIASPITYGIFHQKVLLPKYYMELSREQLKYILIHEKVHIDSRDNLRKILVILAVCLHWFNPFAWVMYLCYNQDLELACDEKVVRQVGEKSRGEYANALISLASAELAPKKMYSAFLGSSLKQRIILIMGHRGKKVWTGAMYVLAGIIAVLAFAMPESVAGKNETTSVESEEPVYEAVDVYEIVKMDELATWVHVKVKTKEDVELCLKVFLNKGFAITSNRYFSTYLPRDKEAWKPGIKRRTEGTVTVPEAVRYEGRIYPVRGVGNRTFYKCSKVTEIVLPDRVREIKENSFRGCASLTRLRIPADLEIVEKNPFIGCTSLESFEQAEKMKGQYRVVDGVLYTDYGRFLKVYPQGKTKTHVEIGENVTQIAKAAFYGAQIEKITLPENMIRVKGRGFQNCRDLRIIEACETTQFAGDAFEGAGAVQIQRYRSGPDG